MTNGDALNEAIQVEKIPTGFIVAVFFHGATEHLVDVFSTGSEAQAAGQKRLTKFRVALSQDKRT